MDEPASDRLSGNLVIAIVVLVVAVAALVFAGYLRTHEPEPVSTGAGTGTTVGTTPGTTAGTTPGSAPAASCNSGASVPRPALQTTDDVTPQLQAALVGCPAVQVTARANAAGWTVRVVERDGEALAVTMDYNPARLDLSINDGVVTDVATG
jgi:hypothetical protein